MRRRSFLKSAAAAALPASCLHDLLTAQSLSQSSVRDAAALAPHTVGAGEDRSGPPHTLGFSSLTFKVLPRETGGALFLIEHSDLKPGGGPPLHVHLNQEEWFYVVQGAVTLQVGEQRLTLQPGESVLAPRRVAHTFSAVAPSRMLIAFCPAGKMEQYLRDTEAMKSPPPDIAAYFRRYEMEYVGPSPFVRS